MRNKRRVRPIWMELFTTLFSFTSLVAHWRFVRTLFLGASIFDAHRGGKAAHHSGSLKRFEAPRGKQLFGSIIGEMKGPNVRGPQCEVVAKNISRPIGRLRWDTLGGNVAKFIDGPDDCRADYVHWSGD